MRSIFYILVSLIVLSTSAHAADRPDVVKVKTGILPGGGFYSLYHVECQDQRTAAIASLDGKRRWCTLHAGDLNCSSSRQEVSVNACVTNALAAADDNTAMGGNN